MAQSPILRCPECEKQGLIPERITAVGGMNTTAYVSRFYDSEGAMHLHDANHYTEILRCSNGHNFIRNIPHTCWCGWKQEIQSGNTSISWTASVPTNTTIKIETSVPVLDAMWEIVQELSNSNGAPLGGIGQPCIFCNAKDEFIANIRHEDTCIIRKAEKLVWQKEDKERMKG